MRTPQARLVRGADVLVVDDDIGIRKIERFALEDAGYAVYEAHNGFQALDRLRTHPHGLVVLLDLNMPGLDGWGVLQAVQAETLLARRHKFLLVTANSEALPSPLIDLLDDMHVPVIGKPCSLDRILGAVAHAIARADLTELPDRAMKVSGSASVH